MIPATSTGSRCAPVRVRVSLLAALLCLGAAGCAFDVSRLQKTPTRFEAEQAGAEWILNEDVTIWLGTGFPTKLRKNTHWSMVGKVPEGDVFRTHDQLVTAEASNIYEAWPVMQADLLVGFYLPVEHAFAAARPPVQLARSQGGGT